MRIDLAQLVSRARQFGGADAIRTMDDLAVEIGEIDVVGIDEANSADSGGGKVKESR